MIIIISTVIVSPLTTMSFSIDKKYNISSKRLCEIILNISQETFNDHSFWEYLEMCTNNFIGLHVISFANKVVVLKIQNYSGGGNFVTIDWNNLEKSVFCFKAKIASLKICNSCLKVCGTYFKFGNNVIEQEDFADSVVCEYCLAHILEDKHKDNENEDEICAICYDDINMKKPILLHCSHKFHFSCITLMFLRNNEIPCHQRFDCTCSEECFSRCPLCRYEFELCCKGSLNSDDNQWTLVPPSEQDDDTLTQLSQE